MSDQSNELLSVIIDFDADILSKLNIKVFMNSIHKFLNLFRLQSAQAESRIYIAFPHNSYLLFPLFAEDPKEDDMKSLKQM